MLKAIITRKKERYFYPNLPSALRPVPHSDSIPVAIPNDIPDFIIERESSWEGDDDTGKLTDNYAPQNPDIAQNDSHAELNTWIRDLDLLQKMSAELLGSHMKFKHLLAPGMSFSWYRSHEEDLRAVFNDWFPCILLRYFWINHRVGSYCTYNATEWRIFINTNMQKIKVVL